MRLRVVGRVRLAAATTSSPGIAAGSPWNSQPTSPGMASPFFMPVPANSQWSGRVHVQSPLPLNGVLIDILQVYLQKQLATSCTLFLHATRFQPLARNML